MTFYKNMKTLSSLVATTVLLFGSCLAEVEHVAQDEPAFFSITSSAFEHLAVVHEIVSEHRTKNVSLVIKDQMVIPTINSGRHYIKLEHLDFRKDEAPPSGSIPIHLKGLKCWVNPSLIAQMKNSTIDFVHILTTDTNAANATALVLRPSEPIIVRPNQKEK